MNWLDIVLLAIIALSAVAGFTRGLARIIVGIAAAAVALLLALWCYGSVGSLLISYVSHKSVAGFLGFVIVFGVVLLLGAVAGRLLAAVFKWVGLGWLDRLLGGAFGVVRGLLVAMAIVLVMMAFSIHPPPRSVAESRVAPYLVDAAAIVSWLAPKELYDGFRRSYDKTREVWEQALRRRDDRP